LRTFTLPTSSSVMMKRAMPSKRFVQIDEESASSALFDIRIASSMSRKRMIGATSARTSGIS
jgi:hypothetical protein